MSFTDKLQQIEELQQAINNHGKIAADILRKINYKFRLDWNYYSNMIEGNSLTMQETRSIMVGNITVDGKPIKDVMEMKGHDDVISDILKIGKSELNISEKRIKEIHKGIMHEEDTEKQPFIGQWKTTPNYLYNYKKERFDFTAPADVPDAIHKLINWLNTEKEKIARKSKDALHPIHIAFQFHIDYVTIHPFYDGNGRTARIFTNLILISYGYPPLYVKDTERETYNQYLGEIQTYGGDTELFCDFMAGLLLRSEQLVLDAIEGKVIDDANDWQKKIRLLKIERNEDEIEIVKNEEIIEMVVYRVIIPFINLLANKLQEFEDLFNEKEVVVNSISHNASRTFTKISYLTESIFSIIESLSDGIELQYKFKTFKRNKSNTFSISTIIEWQFNNLTYSYFNESHTKIIEKKYHDFYNQNETDAMINDIGERLYKEIETHLKEQ